MFNQYDFFDYWTDWYNGFSDRYGFYTAYPRSYYKQGEEIDDQIANIAADVKNAVKHIAGNRDAIKELQDAIKKLTDQLPDAMKQFVIDQLTNYTVDNGIVTNQSYHIDSVVAYSTPNTSEPYDAQYTGNSLTKPGQDNYLLTLQHITGTSRWRSTFTTPAGDVNSNPNASVTFDSGDTNLRRVHPYVISSTYYGALYIKPGTNSVYRWGWSAGQVSIYAVTTEKPALAVLNASGDESFTYLATDYTVMSQVNGNERTLVKLADHVIATISGLAPEKVIASSNQLVALVPGNTGDNTTPDEKIITWPLFYSRYSSSLDQAKPFDTFDFMDEAAFNGQLQPIVSGQAKQAPTFFQLAPNTSRAASHYQAADKTVQSDTNAPKRQDLVPVDLNAHNTQPYQFGGAVQGNDTFNLTTANGNSVVLSFWQNYEANYPASEFIRQYASAMLQAVAAESTRAQGAEKFITDKQTDLMTTVSKLPRLDGTNDWTGNNTFENSIFANILGNAKSADYAATAGKATDPTAARTATQQTWTAAQTFNYLSANNVYMNPQEFKLTIFGNASLSFVVTSYGVQVSLTGNLTNVPVQWDWVSTLVTIPSGVPTPMRDVFITSTSQSGISGISKRIPFNLVLRIMATGEIRYILQRADTATDPNADPWVGYTPGTLTMYGSAYYPRGIDNLFQLNV